MEPSEPIIARPRPSSPQRVVIRAFMAGILLGTLLLLTPWAHTSGAWGDPLVSLFTATSATCVTGLSVVDIGTYYSTFGQCVILGLIQLGGLGIMTLGTVLLLVMGRRLRVRDEVVLMDAMGREDVRGVASVLRRTLVFTLFFETFGAWILAHRLVVRHGADWPHALYSGLFHSVSAFCNAGFGLRADSLTLYREDPAFILTITALIVLGGVGFLVLHNLSSIKWWRRDRIARGRISLHTHVVVRMTVLLLLLGCLAFAALEWTGVLRAVPVEHRLAVSLFHAATPRTAGFNAVDMAHLAPATRFLNVVLMFIGGSPASTAGGIKTVALLVLVATMSALVRGRDETLIHGRTVAPRVVREALAVSLLSILLIGLFYLAMLVTQPHIRGLGTCGASEALLFETVSAFCTVGLSVGITADLNAFGHLCLIVCMFIGRIGPMTIALTVGSRETGRALIRYPEGEMVVG